MINTEKTFNPNSHIIQLKSQQGPKDYLPVAWRLVWFREQCPEGTITTELLDLNRSEECETEVSVWNDEKRKYDKVIKRAKGVAVFRATVTDGKGGSSTGTKTENAACFPDYLEKAETGSIGRALAALGYGTQFTGDELDEGTDRIADAPISHQPQQQERQPDIDPDRPATKQQQDTIARLQKQLGQEPASLDGLSFQDCANLLKELSKRVQSQKQAS
ncbi:MAG TPA: hypothetical protein VHV10_17885 [Ktedonobacteraceae bacterium]|jgi:hypothetical protein|nr:hypothetical protein [Ktedonobacteraceae bacterium]